MHMEDIPNLGPKSRWMLKQAGIHSMKELCKLGAVHAYLQVKSNNSKASLNLLWALEGALTERRWQNVARHDRLRLLMELEDVEQNK